MNETLKRLLRDEIACYDAMLSTTPHLSRIHHAEAALLALLEETTSPRRTIPLEDTLTLVEVHDGRGPL